MSKDKDETVYYQDRKEPFAHMFFFRLSDTSEEAMAKFLDACKTYLSGYEGQTHFSIGTRALQIRRAVSAVDYDVAVNMIFENYAAYEKYKTAQRHMDFVAEVAGMSNHRIVYDSFLSYQAKPVEKRKAEKKGTKT